MISRFTTTSPTQWLTKVENGDWFIYTEPEVTYNKETGLYELCTKETKCL